MYHSEKLNWSTSNIDDRETQRFDMSPSLKIYANIKLRSLLEEHTT